jgi:hypothetical protein
LNDCKTRKVFEPDLEMRIPAGAEFVNPMPAGSNHFSSVLVFHKLSKTVHCDDTLMYFDKPGKASRWIAGFKENSMHFHPSMERSALYRTAEAPKQFLHWFAQLLFDWDFQHLATAHKGVCYRTAWLKAWDLLERSRRHLEELAHENFEKFGPSPMELTCEPCGEDIEDTLWSIEGGCECG